MGSIMKKDIWYTAIAYEYISQLDNSLHFGAVLVKGKPPLDTQKNHEWFIKHIESAPGNYQHKVKEFIKLSSVSEKI